LFGDFAGGGVISPGFNGAAGLGTEGCGDGAGGGGGGAGCLSLQPANVRAKTKRVTADTIFFIVIHLVFYECWHRQLAIQRLSAFCTYLI
jgi:hypothetical protein